MPSQVCISFAQNSCCLAYDQHGQPCAEAAIFYDDLKEKVQANRLVSLPTLAILAESDYQLLKAKKPDVPESKIKEALLWQEQARFFLPLDQIFLEYFECRELNGEQKLYLVAVAKQQLQAKYDLINSSGLKIKRITIPELVYASYIQQKMKSPSCIIWVNIFPDQSKATLFFNGGLISTLRLPTLEKEAMSQALKLFYHEQAAAFADAADIAWAIHCADVDFAKKLSVDLAGDVRLVSLPVVQKTKALNIDNIAVGHAVYGVVTEL